MFFISSKKNFTFSRYSHICISDFSSFFPASHCFRGWLKVNIEFYDIINYLSKNLIAHFVWYLEKEKRYDIETLPIDSIKYFYGKIMQMCIKSLSQTPF